MQKIYTKAKKNIFSINIHNIQTQTPFFFKAGKNIIHPKLSIRIDINVIASEAKQSRGRNGQFLDCFVAALLAMTANGQSGFISLKLKRTRPLEARPLYCHTVPVT
jgi:hypothetical protein